MWKMVPLCLLWCLWRERNYRNFEDICFCFLFWCLVIMIFLFFLFLLARWLLLYTPCVLVAFNDISVTYKKKKKM
jgi:hypothetical protein